MSGTWMDVRDGKSQEVCQIFQGCQGNQELGLVSGMSGMSKARIQKSVLNFTEDSGQCNMTDSEYPS